MTTPNLSLPELSASQSQPHLTINQALRRLDALVQLTVADIANTPPGSPADGDRYIVGTSPTGAWVGHEDEVALYEVNAWVYFTPQPGWTAYVEDVAALYRYEPAGSPPGWNEFVGGGTGPSASVAGVHVYRSTTQSIGNNTQTGIAFDTEVTDDEGFWSASPNPERITVPSGGDGWYVITGYVFWAGVTGGGRRSLIVLNGSTELSRSSCSAPSDHNDVANAVSAACYLVGGDYVELRVLQTQGASVNTQAGRARLSAIRYG